MKSKWVVMGQMGFVGALACLLAGGFLACGDDCRKKIRDGDFELSQGNTTRAIALYEKAIALGGCSDAAEKKATAEALNRGK